MRRAVIALTVCLVGTAAFANGWDCTKNIAEDIICDGRSATFYWGCEYQSDEDSDGSREVTDTTACGYRGPSSYASCTGPSRQACSTCPRE